MTELSVIILNLSEEHQIARCLRSVTDVADEILVMDSFPEHNIREICMAHRAELVEQPFSTTIEQNNFAIDQAKHNHILFIKADEVISKELRDFILLEKQHDFNHDAYCFNVICNYCGQWMKYGTYRPTKKIRLIRKGKAHWGGATPNEKLVVPQEAKVFQAGVNIQQYIFQHYADHLRQTNRYSTTIACNLLYSKKKPSVIKAILLPVWAFINSYFIGLGFLDGWNGFMVARFSSLHNFFIYSKLIELNKKSKVQQVQQEQTVATGTQPESN